MITAEGLEPRPHDCNVYCRPSEGVHAHLAYLDRPMTAAWVAIIAGGQRCEIIDWREAPEVPPVDPTDPEGRAYPYRYVVWSVP